MKLILQIIFCLVLMMNSFSLIAQDHPELVNSGQYIFKKKWTEHMNTKRAGWYFADWTFETNLCEFTPSMATFENGKLQLKIDEKPAGTPGKFPSKPYFGAEYVSAEKYKYGRYIVNMKPQTPAGVVTSFFLSFIEWNANYTQALEWYEIDIEFAGRTDRVQFTLHWMDNTGQQMQSHTVNLGFDAAHGFHDWIIEWTPSFIKFYVDDNWLYTFDDPVLVKEQEHEQYIQMNNWISNSPGWVGTFNPSVLPVITEYDYLIYYQLENPTGIEKNEDTELVIFPNPVMNNEINILSENLKNVHYKIFNLQGEIINESFAKEGLITLSPETLSGIYFLEIYNENQIPKRIKFFRY
ncbi:MAG: family 16 glycosylhydrolase [Cytophagaceae bacterium]